MSCVSAKVLVSTALVCSELVFIVGRQSRLIRRSILLRWDLGCGKAKKIRGKDPELHRRRRDNAGNAGTGQQPVGRTRAATAAQAGGSGDGGQRAKWVRLMMLLRLRERFSCWAGFRLVLTRKGIDAMYKAYKKGRRKRRDAGEDEAETSADESRADPGTGEPEQTASAAEGTLGRGTRRAATSTDYGGPVARRRRAEDGEAEQTRRARRGREQDFAEISRRMYEEIRSSRDPRDHVEDG